MKVKPPLLQSWDGSCCLFLGIVLINNNKTMKAKRIISIQLDLTEEEGASILEALNDLETGTNSMKKESVNFLCMSEALDKLFDLRMELKALMVII